MRKIIIIVSIVLLAAVLSFAGGKQEAKEKATEKVVISFPHMNAVGDPIDQTAQKFKQLVESKNSMVEVKVYPAGQLGDDKRAEQWYTCISRLSFRRRTATMGSFRAGR